MLERYYYNILILIYFIYILHHGVNVNSEMAVHVGPFEDLEKLNYSIYCNFQGNAYKCSGLRYERRHYYDKALQDCTTYDYGLCNHTYNVFTSRSDCRLRCLDVADFSVPTNTTPNVYCRYQFDFGDCNGYHPMWYFDVSEMTCKGFSYSGCGGNTNRFKTTTQCMAACGSVIKHT